MTKSTQTITKIALIPALMAATAGIVIPLGTLPSVTLQTLFVFLAGLLLTPRQAFLSMIVYVLLGSIGLPIFSGYTGGIGVVLAQSLGFLLGFILVAPLISYFKNKNIIKIEVVWYFLILVIANLIIYLLGALYLAYRLELNMWALMSGFTVYFVGDLIKIITAIFVYKRIRNYIV